MASAAKQPLSLHGLGVICGLTAGVWLGAAEAPTKLVNTGISPFAVSLCMVAGVFTARWTFPTLLKGTGYVFADLMEKKHLIVWALLAGALWAVANTLTVFAIRDVGLAVAFPLWNANSLIGLFWGRVLFKELAGADAKNISKVVFGGVAIVIAAIMLGFSTIHGGTAGSAHALRGIIAAIGASFMWGTMYVPYRKAYISGMNPLSFVTVFTIGELGTMFALVLALDGGTNAAVFHSGEVRHLLFWLFLGGFVWVIGDIFQQYATKYLGIGRGIPLSNTNQMWGLAWGALVFGELSHAGSSHWMLVVAGSIVMILGALAVSTAVATEKEKASMRQAVVRECARYELDYDRVSQLHASSSDSTRPTGRAWWDYVIIAAAIAVFIWLGVNAQVPTLTMNFTWIALLSAVLVISASISSWVLWKATRFD